MTKFLSLFSCIFLGACSLNAPSADTDSYSLTSDPMTKDIQNTLPLPSEEVAIIATNHGDIYVRFFPEQTPKTVENFIGLSKKGYYDGIIFHRIIDGFMMQGGDPTGTGMGGESFFGKAFDDEFSPYLSNIPYSISMANAGPGTNGSQFFINQAANTFLDGKHSVFGQVIGGKEVVEKIMKVKTGAGDKPLNDVIMEKVSIVPFSEISEKISQ